MPPSPAIRSFLLAVAAALAVLLAPLPAAAQPEPVDGRVVEVTPAEGERVELGDARLAGPVQVTGHPAGLVVTERLDPERYLLGLQEVPFSWPREALRAQAVAARTYLAWTLARGRSSAGQAYGYDICATTACQVYGGLAWVEGPGGDRWREAVPPTAGEILLYRGSPAQALYSSTSGGRTRSVEDVFPGATPLPYLRAVPSPGEESPFVDWTFRVDEAAMEAMLDHAGVLAGELETITTEVTDDGDGPWQVVIEGSDGTRRVPTWELRTLLNRAAADLYPDRFPARRLDGSGYRYPQTVLSPTYTITAEEWWVVPPGGEPERQVRYRVAGHGWGHLVGMSQYGAEAMASRGATYADILAHYYSGLRPRPAGDWLPPEITVGLAVEEETVTLRPLGPVDVSIDGEVIAEGVVGSWRIETSPGGLAAYPPEGLGEAPELSGLRVWYGRSGEPTAVRVRTTAPGELRAVVTAGTTVVGDSGWTLEDTGRHRFGWDELVDAEDVSGPLRVTVSVRAPAGSDQETLRVLAVAPRTVE